MDYLIISLASFFISMLTLFSGFGLGTVLMPIFAVFFPLPVAIASTAVIHLLNNLFKAALVGQLANWGVVLKFGIPAAATSALGAYLLRKFSHLPPMLTYSIAGHDYAVTPLGLLIGFIIIAASLLELIPKFSTMTLPSKYIPLGGALSGFLGGFSGNQGVLRSAFLIKAGLSKEEFIGTSVIASIIVDTVRLMVYGWNFISDKHFHALSSDMLGILLTASLAAFLGAYLGSRFIEKSLLESSN